MNILQRAMARMIFGPPPIKANSDPPGTWVDWLTGSTSSAPMTETTALNLSGVFCAVTIISNAMKCLPLFTYERLPGQGKRPAIEHPNYWLLHNEPSPNFSPSRFQRLLTFWAVLWGNGRAEIKRARGTGEVLSLNPIHPTRSKTETRADGSVWHLVRNDDGTWTEIPDRDMFHIQGLSEDGVNGLSLLGVARRSLGLTVSAEEYGTRFFDNNARPSVLLKHPAKLSEEAEIHLRKTWSHAFGGRGQHGTAILEEGMDVVTLGMPNEDAQFLETRQFQLTELARWFNIPPHKLKDLLRATFDNITEQSLDFVGETVLPWAKDWEQEADRKLFTEEDRERFFAEFLLDALLRADPKSRNEAFEIQRRNGVRNANEWRAAENMNPIEGAAGDMFIVESNMTNAETLAQGGAAEPVAVTGGGGNAVAAQVEAVALAHMPSLSNVFYRMAKVEMNAARRAAKKEDNIASWSVEYFEGHGAVVMSALIPCIESLGAAVHAVAIDGMTVDLWDTFVGAFTKRATSDHVAWATDLVRGRINTDDWQIQYECSTRARDLLKSFAQEAMENRHESNN